MMLKIGLAKGIYSTRNWMFDQNENENGIRIRISLLVYNLSVFHHLQSNKIKQSNIKITQKKNIPVYYWH